MVCSSSGLSTVSATLAKIKDICADHRQPRSSSWGINVCYGKCATTYCTTSEPTEYDYLEDRRPLGCEIRLGIGREVLGQSEQVRYLRVLSTYDGGTSDAKSLLGPLASAWPFESRGRYGVFGVHRK